MTKLARSSPDRSSKAKQSTREREGLSVRAFFSIGLGLTFIVFAILVLAVLHRGGPDPISRALGVLAFFSIAIWGGIALVAVPTLLAKASLRAWGRRGLTHRAVGSATWDDWLDGPRSR